MWLNRVTLDWVGEVKLLCFDLALLHIVIGLEILHHPLSLALRRKPVFTFILLWFWFYNTQLKFPLKENPVHGAYLENSIYVKPLNCSSSRFWINTVLSSLQRVLFSKWLYVFPLMTDIPSSACNNISLLLQLLGYLRKSTCRFSFHLRWCLII